jgi:putative metallohydrolase (TIGR04338 family)
MYDFYPNPKNFKLSSFRDLAEHALEVYELSEERNAYLRYLRNKELVFLKFEDTGKDTLSYSDTGRSKVYRAEHQTENQFWALGVENRKFGTIEELEKRLKTILRSKLWKSLSDKETIKVELMKDMGNRTRYAGVSHGGKIRFSPHYMNEFVLLHELAHEAGQRHHGLGFRLTLVKLVSGFMGTEVAKLLKKNYKKQGLKMSKPSKPKNFEKWVVAYRRMKHARAIKDGFDPNEPVDYENELFYNNAETITDVG